VRVEAGEHPVEGVVARDAVREGQESLQPVLLGPPERVSTSCYRSMFATVRVNPWDGDAVVSAERFADGLSMPE
jgi:hypothetical protein